MMNVSYLMRLVSVIVFVLAIFGVPLAPLTMVALGLALWVGSTLVPPGS